MAQTAWQSFFQLLISGLASGSIYALIAVGFAIIYKATRVLNFAQGDLMVLGGYFCFSLMVYLHVPYILAFLIAIGLLVLVGMAIQGSILNRMIGEPIFAVVMITIGLSSVFQGLFGMIWGHEEQKIPTAATDIIINLSGVFLTLAHAIVMGVAAIFFIGFFLFFKYSRMGIAMRCTASDQDIALLLGMSVKKVFSLSWAIACVVACIGGVFFGQINYMVPTMGAVGLRAFPAIVLGGLDSIGGAIIGGLAVGVLENLTSGYLDVWLGGAGLKEIVPYILLVIVLMIRPYGLFGTEEITRV
ncbi:MAG: branched-chain amino acid ABC transporter permease [Desulfobacteraceae bacterium]|jgi:branched-chain amino acid transport system permease protein